MLLFHNLAIATVAPLPRNDMIATVAPLPRNDMARRTNIVLHCVVPLAPRNDRENITNIVSMATCVAPRNDMELLCHSSQINQ